MHSCPLWAFTPHSCCQGSGFNRELLLHLPPRHPFSRSFNFLHADIVWSHGEVRGRRCREPKCHPLWCVVDNETGKSVWITPWTLFHFLNLCPQASPATLSYYFPIGPLATWSHISPTMGQDKEKKNTLCQWKPPWNSISLIKRENKSLFSKLVTSGWQIIISKIEQKQKSFTKALNLNFSQSFPPLACHHAKSPLSSSTSFICLPVIL